MNDSLQPGDLRLGRLFHSCHLRLRRAVDQAIKKSNINLRHVWVMSVAISDRPSTQKEIARILDLDENVVVRLLDYLEQLKYVIRSPGMDARTRVITITQQGREAFEQANLGMTDTYRSLLKGFSQDEVLMLVRLLRKFVQLQ